MRIVRSEFKSQKLLQKHLGTETIFDFCVLIFAFTMTTPLSFLQSMLDELKKVTWPTRDEVVRLTGVVIIISVIVGLYIGALDFIFTAMLQALIK